MPKTRNLVVVHPDGREYFLETPDDRYGMNYIQAAETAAGNWNLTTSRKKPEVVPLKVYQLNIASGMLVRYLLGEVGVTPRFKPMTDTEFKEELLLLIKDLPPAFQGWVEYGAWEKTQDEPYEEVIGQVQGMLPRLKATIKQHDKRK